MTFDEFGLSLRVCPDCVRRDWVEPCAVHRDPAEQYSFAVDHVALRRIWEHLIATGVDVSAVLRRETPVATDRVTSDELHALASAHRFCWHCYDGLAELPDAPRCFECPAFGDCGDEECEAPGCKLERPNVPPVATPPKPPDLARLRELARKWRNRAVELNAWGDTTGDVHRADELNDRIREFTEAIDAIEKGML